MREWQNTFSLKLSSSADISSVSMFWSCQSGPGLWLITTAGLRALKYCANHWMWPQSESQWPSSDVQSSDILITLAPVTIHCPLMPHCPVPTKVSVCQSKLAGRLSLACDGARGAVTRLGVNMTDAVITLSWADHTGAMTWRDDPVMTLGYSSRLWTIKAS